MTKVIKSKIKKILGDVHFGISPDSDCYVNGIYIENKQKSKKFYKNSTDLIKNIMSNKISVDEIETDTISVLFSDLLFSDVETEYRKYAIGTTDK